MKIHRLNEPTNLLPHPRYLTEIRAALKSIEEVLANAEGFRQVDARERLRHLAEVADSVYANLVRTAVTKVKAP
jgi:hypothetical protein